MCVIVPICRKRDLSAIDKLKCVLVRYIPELADFRVQKIGAYLGVIFGCDTKGQRTAPLHGVCKATAKTPETGAPGQLSSLA